MTISEYVHWRNVKDEIVLFDERTQVYRTLNAASSAVWQRVAQGMSEAEIVESLLETYEARAEVIAADVRAFLDISVREGLLTNQKVAG